MASTKRFEWSCGGEPLVVTFAGGRADVAMAEWRGRKWRLSRAVSGSGARYASAGAEYWEHQGRVTWTLAGGESRTCTRKAG